MSRFKLIGLFASSFISAAAMPVQSFAQSPQTQADAAAMAEVKAKLNGKTIMYYMELVAEKDPNYSGPAHLHPVNRKALRQQFLPPYLPLIDQLYDSGLSKADFTFGQGDQTQTVSAVDITGPVLFLSGSSTDEPLNEELWGSLTARELFTALDLPTFKRLHVTLSYPVGNKRVIETDTSLSSNYLSIQAKDEMGIWVYSLEMSLNSNADMIKFTTKDSIETYKIDGLTTDDITSIKVNKKDVFTKPIAELPSVKLRRELGI